MAEADRLEAQEIQRQAFDMIHGERKAHGRQGGEIAFAFDAGLEHRLLAELENDLARQVAVDAHIIQELREEFLVGQCVAGNIAEDADVAVLLGQAAHDLHAAEQQQIVHHAHQAGRARPPAYTGRA